MKRNGKIDFEKDLVKRFYRVDVVDENEIVTVCYTDNEAEAKRVQRVWNETHNNVFLFELNYAVKDMLTGIYYA